MNTFTQVLTVADWPILEEIVTAEERKGKEERPVEEEPAPEKHAPREYKTRPQDLDWPLFDDYFTPGYD